MHWSLTPLFHHLLCADTPNANGHSNSNATTLSCALTLSHLLDALQLLPQLRPHSRAAATMGFLRRHRSLFFPTSNEAAAGGSGMAAHSSGAAASLDVPPSPNETKLRA